MPPVTPDGNCVPGLFLMRIKARGYKTDPIIHEGSCYCVCLTHKPNIPSSAYKFFGDSTYGL